MTARHTDSDRPKVIDTHKRLTRLIRKTEVALGGPLTVGGRAAARERLIRLRVELVECEARQRAAAEAWGQDCDLEIDSLDMAMF